eukprot:CCRYP_014515-RA/>CCRYP_014515-RA protein AED:0.01 eAED:0.01 QI:87/1/1/1/1/1/2/3376/443
MDTLLSQPETNQKILRLARMRGSSRLLLSAATLAALTVTRPTTSTTAVAPSHVAFITAVSSPRPHVSSHRPPKQRRAHPTSNHDVPSTSPPDVLCLGETLWDSLPSGMYLGGAPTNVAVHLASLLRRRDRGRGSGGVAVVTCLGDDALGREARRRLEWRGVRMDYVQFHGEWETGMAIATIDQNGDAVYEFNTPAAWDGLDMNEPLVSNLLRSHENDSTSTRVYIMGTIAARLQFEHGATSASTLTAVRNNAPEGSVVLDVNLRSPWYNPRHVLELARGECSSSKDAKKLALLKLNEEELVVLEDWCGFKAECSDENGLTGTMLKNRMKQLASSLNSLRICVTRGANGAALWCDGASDSNDDVFHENTGYSMESSGDCDTVGAGDAFLAALVNSLFILDEDPGVALARACALGGYVAGCRGATPSHEDAPVELRRIFQHATVH